MQVYDDFRDKLVAAAKAQKVGPTDGDDFGPVINERQLNTMLAAIDKARGKGRRCWPAATRLTDPAHAKGCYLAPTVIENASAGRRHLAP